MAKVTGPLFGLRATQTIGKTITYASWRGIQYARTRVIPANPRSSNQVSVRQAFAAVNAIWSAGNLLLWNPSANLARGKPLTDRNVFMRLNAVNVRENGDITDLVVSPGQSPITPATAVVTSPGAGDVSGDFAMPDTIPNWTFDNHLLVAILSFDTSMPPYTTFVGQATQPTPGGTAAISSLPTGTYEVRAFNQYHLTGFNDTIRYGREEQATQAVA